MTDPIADMLTRIRNAYAAGKKVVEVPFSNQKLHIANLLIEDGYIESAIKQPSSNHQIIHIKLKYIQNKPALTSLIRVSKPGRRIYSKATKLSTPLSGFGLAIVSTSQGIMSAKKARELKLGGEIICKVW